MTEITFTRRTPNGKPEIKFREKSDLFPKVLFEDLTITFQYEDLARCYDQFISMNPETIGSCAYTVDQNGKISTYNKKMAIKVIDDAQ